MGRHGRKPVNSTPVTHRLKFRKPSTAFTFLRLPRPHQPTATHPARTGMLLVARHAALRSQSRERAAQHESQNPARPRHLLPEPPRPRPLRRFRILKDESEEDFHQLIAALREEYAPATVTEETLAQKIAQHQWLADRALRLRGSAFGRNERCGRPEPARVVPALSHDPRARLLPRPQPAPKAEKGKTETRIWL